MNINTKLILCSLSFFFYKEYKLNSLIEDHKNIVKSMKSKTQELRNENKKLIDMVHKSYDIKENYEIGLCEYCYDQEKKLNNFLYKNNFISEKTFSDIEDKSLLKYQKCEKFADEIAKEKQDTS